MKLLEETTEDLCDPGWGKDFSDMTAKAYPENKLTSWTSSKLKIYVLQTVSQAINYYMIPLIWNAQKRKLERHKVDQYLPGAENKA